MPFIEMPGIEDTNEPEVQETGEYALIVENANEHVSESSGKTSIRVLLGFSEIPEAATIFHYLPLPAEDDDDTKRKNKMLMTRRFLEHFQVPYKGGFIIEDLFGASAICRVTKDLRDEADPDAGYTNNLKLPQLKG